jgi:hypothetical protein
MTTNSRLIIKLHSNQALKCSPCLYVIVDSSSYGLYFGQHIPNKFTPCINSLFGILVQIGITSIPISYAG